MRLSRDPYILHLTSHRATMSEMDRSSRDLLLKPLLRRGAAPSNDRKNHTLSVQGRKLLTKIDRIDVERLAVDASGLLLAELLSELEVAYADRPEPEWLSSLRSEVTSRRELLSRELLK